MRSSFKAAAMALATTAVAFSADLLAQTSSAGPMSFSAFDRDGNGEITQQEFDAARAERQAARAASGAPMRGMASAPTFAQMDANGDGKISPAELAQAQQQRMQGAPGTGPGAVGGAGPAPGAGMGPGRGMGMGRNMPSFADFDLNGDGVLTEQEFNEARAKTIQQRASQGYPMYGLAHAQSFADIDTNKDGKVSPEEFAAAQARHRQQMMGTVPPAPPSPPKPQP